MLFFWKRAVGYHTDLNWARLRLPNGQIARSRCLTRSHNPPGVDADNYHFIVERPGLDVTRLKGGAQEVYDIE